MPVSLFDSQRAIPQPSVWILALALTLLNAVKPLHIDDTAYYYFARQISQRPLDPYDFTIFWYQYPEPANQVLAPPLLLSWWAIGLKCFGDHPVVWKLWLFPFAWLFVYSLHGLFRRMARGLEVPLTWMTVLSPTFLPSLNLMLDVPALALSLTALVLFLRACAGRSLVLAAVAGLVAGMAMQTKYTSFTAPAAMLIYAVLFRRVRLGLVAAITSALVFAGWECFLLWRQDESHFLIHLSAGREGLSFLREKLHFVLPLLTIVGAVGSGIGLLGLAALRVPRWAILLAGVGIFIGYVLLAAIPESDAVLITGPAGQADLTVNHLILGVFGLLVFGTAGLAAGRLLCRKTRGHGWFSFSWARPTRRKAEWFLLLWLAVELAGYFVLSPFLAVRRVMTLVVVLTIITGRLAACSCHRGLDRALVRWVARFGIVLGLAFYVVDLREAFAQKDSIAVTARWIRQRDSEGTIWYVGHWGFQFYAEQAGMNPVVPPSRAGPPPSMLHRGDWLIVPDERLDQQDVRLDLQRLELMTVVMIHDPLPLRTVVGYYGGNSPLERHDGPRLRVAVYRVTADWTAGSQ